MKGIHEAAVAYTWSSSKTANDKTETGRRIQMAKLRGVWIYAVPRPPTDDLELLGGFTLILDAADKQKLGDGLMKVHIHVMDWDEYSSDDLVQKDDSFQLGPANLNVGPNTFGINAFVKHSKLKTIEGNDPDQNTAELYFHLQAEKVGSGPTLKTAWEDSKIDKARYK